ncbi:MAG TPA: mandelate racemase/muconate lactonizing enzyme family protein [Thermomicrobiales bacterium]|nr:mandelate racemase/muconate lactonizing enzyme family protein [Thermomicrobiales bacterium]
MTHTPKSTAVRIVAVEPTFTVEQPGAEFAFGASTAGALTFAHVRVRVADAAGREADGWGAIFLSHPWAFPGAEPDGAAKDALMRAIIVALGERLVAMDTAGHPLDHFLAIEPELDAIAARVAAAQGIDVPVPPLCTLVSLSPIDAAIHDAFGRLHGVNAFDALGSDYVGWDLSHVLGDAFDGKYLADFVRREPVDAIPVSHTVGATDPLTPEEAGADAIPLTEWIASDGVFSFKVKLKGKDLAWDTSRLIDVFDVATRSAGAAGPVRIFGDLNEQGPSMEYILALIDGVKTRSPEAFAALDALEQPARRDLGEGAAYVGDAAAQVPIVLDEGLTSLAAIDRAIELGWNGIALKTCKTQSLMLLAIAKARGTGLHVSVQDLTNPGIALLHSVALAARLPEIAPLETNQRQYFPRASAPEAAVYPEVYTIRNGRIPARDLTGPGLGFDVSRIDRDVFRR